MGNSLSSLNSAGFGASSPSKLSLQHGSDSDPVQRSNASSNSSSADESIEHPTEIEISTPIISGPSGLNPKARPFIPSATNQVVNSLVILDTNNDSSALQDYKVCSEEPKVARNEYIKVMYKPDMNFDEKATFNKTPFRPQSHQATVPYNKFSTKLITPDVEEEKPVATYTIHNGIDTKPKRKVPKERIPPFPFKEPYIGEDGNWVNFGQREEFIDAKYIWNNISSAELHNAEDEFLQSYLELLGTFSVDLSDRDEQRRLLLAEQALIQESIDHIRKEARINHKRNLLEKIAEKRSSRLPHALPDCPNPEDYMRPSPQIAYAFSTQAAKAMDLMEDTVSNKPE